MTSADSVRSRWVYPIAILAVCALAFLAASCPWHEALGFDVAGWEHPLGQIYCFAMGVCTILALYRIVTGAQLYAVTIASAGLAGFVTTVLYSYAINDASDNLEGVLMHEGMDPAPGADGFQFPFFIAMVATTLVTLVAGVAVYAYWEAEREGKLGNASGKEASHA